MLVYNCTMSRHRMLQVPAMQTGNLITGSVFTGSICSYLSSKTPKGFKLFPKKLTNVLLRFNKEQLVLHRRSPIFIILMVKLYGNYSPVVDK